MDDDADFDSLCRRTGRIGKTHYAASVSAAGFIGNGGAAVDDDFSNCCFLFFVNAFQRDLQGIGKVNLPLRNAGIALLVQTALLVGLLMFTELDLYALVICLIVYSGMMCILNSISIRRCIGVKEDFKNMFLLPLLASALMGVCAKGVYMGLNMLVESNVICLIPSMITAVIVYAVTAAVNEEQLLGFPKGEKIVKIAKKYRLLYSKK